MKLSESSLKLGEKVFFWIVLISALIYLIVQSTISLLKYFDKPTFTEMTMTKLQEATFPAITLCPLYHRGLKEDVLKVSVCVDPFFQLLLLQQAAFLSTEKWHIKECL